MHTILQILNVSDLLVEAFEVNEKNNHQSQLVVYYQWMTLWNREHSKWRKSTIVDRTDNNLFAFSGSVCVCLVSITFIQIVSIKILWLCIQVSTFFFRYKFRFYDIVLSIPFSYFSQIVMQPVKWNHIVNS